jgi:hypothetical protein
MRWVNANSVYSSDYNGYRPNPGATEQYRWQTPGGTANFSTLKAFSAATGQERNGVELDVDTFEKMTLPDPAKRHQVLHAMDVNFQLKPGSKAVDAGEVIPTVNDGFVGKAPDLGALEVGQAPPHYGPRWLTAQPFYR